MKSGVWIALAVAVCALCCGGKMQTREAVERGVLKGVTARGINSNAMDVSITSVKFRGNQADAVVAFSPKGGRISDGLMMRYTLEQRGNEWVITGRSAVDMKRHTGALQTPPSTMDQNSGAVNPLRALPPGHPPLSGTGK